MYCGVKSPKDKEHAWLVREARIIIGSSVFKGHRGGHRGVHPSLPGSQGGGDTDPEMGGKYVVLFEE